MTDPDRRAASVSQEFDAGQLRQLYVLMIRLLQAGTREAVEAVAAADMHDADVAKELTCRAAQALRRIEAVEAEHRRRCERRQALLLDELNHRVKNTLATVQALAIQTLKHEDGPARELFLARLFALSGQHDLLALSNWEGASLEGVLRRALAPWHETRGDGRFVIAGPPVHLDPKRALALGMAFHELAGNAARHGALSREGGVVEIRWSITDAMLRLTWRERGGPPLAVPGPKGFGLRLVEQGLAREIGGDVSLTLAPEGLVCAWEMALTRSAQ